MISDSDKSLLLLTLTLTLTATSYTSFERQLLKVELSDSERCLLAVPYRPAKATQIFFDEFADFFGTPLPKSGQNLNFWR